MEIWVQMNGFCQSWMSLGCYRIMTQLQCFLNVIMLISWSQSSKTQAQISTILLFFLKLIPVTQIFNSAYKDDISLVVKRQSKIVPNFMKHQIDPVTGVGMNILDIVVV